MSGTQLNNTCCSTWLADTRTLCSHASEVAAHAWTKGKQVCRVGKCTVCLAGASRSTLSGNAPFVNMTIFIFAGGVSDSVDLHAPCQAHSASANSTHCQQTEFLATPLFVWLSVWLLQFGCHVVMNPVGLIYVCLLSCMLSRLSQFEMHTLPIGERQPKLYLHDIRSSYLVLCSASANFPGLAC